MLQSMEQAAIFITLFEGFTMDTLQFKIRGTAPLLMHNEQGANPRNKYALELKTYTSKRKKTEEDQAAISRVEFFSGLYWNEQDGYHLPERVITATLLASAKQYKLGTQFKQGVLMLDATAPFRFADDKKAPESLFQKDEYIDFRGVRVGTAKVMRTRPIFREWESEFSLVLVGEKVDNDQIRQVVVNAGKFVGMGDYRPKYGRFSVVEGA